MGGINEHISYYLIGRQPVNKLEGLKTRLAFLDLLKKKYSTKKKYKNTVKINDLI